MPVSPVRYSFGPRTMNRLRALVASFVEWRKKRTHVGDTYGGLNAPANLQQVLAKELSYIQRHRHPGQPLPQIQRTLVGLALSGGGIRSATTNLGILQALSRMGVLPIVDYMSTVSGGGYIGTCLSALLSWNGDPPASSKDQCTRFTFEAGRAPTFSTATKNFPFRAEFEPGLRSAGGDIVGHLRTHGNFLMAHVGFLTRHTLRGVGNFLTGSLLNVTAFLLILFTVSAIYLTAALWVAPDLAGALGTRPSAVLPDTARPALIDVDSSVTQIKSAACPRGEASCEVETRTTRRAPTLWERVKHNTTVVGTAFQPLFTGGVDSRRSTLSMWNLGPSGRFFPLLLPIVLGVALAGLAFLWLGLALSHYLGGDTAKVSRLRRGESVEDAFERRVLSRLAALAALVAFGAVIVLHGMYPNVLKGSEQLLWLFVPFAVIASMRVTSILIAILILPRPWLSPHFWSRRMRSLWGAFQAITIYGWWLLLLLALLPAAIYALRDHSLALGSSAFVALAATRLLTSKRARENTRWKVFTGRLRNRLLGVLVALLLTLGVLFFAALIAGYAETSVQAAIIALITASLLAILGLLADTNKLGPHYFYRDRLAETYLLSELPDPKGRLGVYQDAMELPLRCLHGDPKDGKSAFRNTAPYQLISAAINLAGSRDLTRKDRKSGYWLFSKLYCGSIHTGFRETAVYRGGETMLARAVAISGAAASAAIGRFTFFAQAFATVLFNIRLGHWLENPRGPDSVNRQERGIFWPHYLWREVIMRTNETTRLVNLSDGGHTGDNIGIYPLLQRRCKVIIACDAECDPAVTFGSFTEAIRQAYIDMGIDVDIDLTMLRPDKVTGLSRSHCAVGRIRYPDREDQDSYLVYLKNSLTGDEPEPQLNYKTQSADFPHESTADLFFDDSQFESYRALGVHIAEHTFGPWVTCNLFDMVRKHHWPESVESQPVAT